MKKYLFIAAAICVFLSSCAKNDSASIEIKNEPSSNPYAELSAQIESLNQDYLIPETRAKWWKYLITAIVDAGVGLINLDVGEAISASTFTWNVLKEIKEKSTTSATDVALEPSLRASEISLTNLEISEGNNDGEIHNTVIYNLYDRYGEEMFEFESEELLSLISTEVYNLTGSSPVSNDTNIEAFAAEMDTYTSAYLRSNSVNDFVTELKVLHPDKADELEVLKVSLEGFQYVDPETDNGEYAKKVVTIIKDSNIDSTSKDALISGVSIANASVRLWNE